MTATCRRLSDIYAQKFFIKNATAQENIKRNKTNENFCLFVLKTNIQSQINFINSVFQMIIINIHE